MASQHDDELEEIFLRRRMGITARRQLDTDDHASFEGAVAKFPAAIKLPPEGGTGVASRLYPLLGLSMEPGTVLPTGQHRVGYTLKSPTAGMRFEVEAWFWVTVGEPEGHQSDAGYRVLSGDFPAGCVAALPTSLHLPSRSASPLRRELRSLDRDGTRAWEQDFFAAIKPMLFRIVGDQLGGRRHPLKIESTDEWGKAVETAVKGGAQFSGPDRAGVNWTNWANRNIRRDVVREQDKRSGRSHADQSIKRFAMAKRPHMTEAELGSDAADLYLEWRYEAEYRQALKKSPDLTYESFVESVAPESVVSETFPLERFRRALEPAAVVLSLDAGCNSGSTGTFHPDEVPSGEQLVGDLIAEHAAAGGSEVGPEDVRLWLIRRSVIEPTSEVEVARSKQIDLDDIEERFFLPWSGNLSWRTRAQRPMIRRQALAAIADTVVGAAA